MKIKSKLKQILEKLNTILYNTKMYYIIFSILIIFPHITNIIEKNQDISLIINIVRYFILIFSSSYFVIVLMIIIFLSREEPEEMVHKNEEKKEIDIHELNSNFMKAWDTAKKELNFLLDIEEWALVKFLKIRREKHYFCYVLSEFLIIILIYIFLILSFFDFNYLLGMNLCFSIFTALRLWKSRVFTGDNLFIVYQFKRKEFREIKNQLLLIFNNTYISQNFIESKDEFSIYNNRINSYCGIFPPVYYYIQKMQVIGVLGLIFTIIFNFYIEPIKIEDPLFGTALLILLIFISFVIILPGLITFKKYKKILSKNSDLLKSIELLRIYQLNFSLYTKILDLDK